MYLIYKLKIDSVLPISDSNGTCVAGYSLNNLAELYLNGTQIWTDTANVTATCPATKSLTILKQVQTSTGTWAKSNTAILGNTLTYQLTIKNTGNSTISNVTARDIVPQYTNYIVGSTKLNGTVANDQIITTTGLNLGSLNASQQDIVTLQVKLYGCIPIGGYTLTNTGYAWADTVTQISDSATTSVNVMAPSI